MDLKGDITATLTCQNKQQKLRIGNIHNREEATLLCDQPTERWSFVSVSDKVIKINISESI